MFCATEVQKRVCCLPGYAVLCPVILQENGNSFERDNQKAKTRRTSAESKRRWKCPTCKYNSNAHYFDGEERAAGLSTAEQRQDLGFSNQSYRTRQKKRTSNTNDRRQDKNSNYPGRSKNGEKIHSYKKENSKGYNPYCPDSCNERESYCSCQYGNQSSEKGSPYLLKICLVPTMPKKKQHDQKRRKKKHSKKKNTKAPNSSRIEQKERSKGRVDKSSDACYRIFIKCEAVPATGRNVKSDSNHDCCDCEQMENLPPCCLCDQEKTKTPQFVGIISGWPLFVEESFD